LSWHEYYSGCSDLGRFVPTAPLSMGFTVSSSDLFHVYKPDVTDLNLDCEAREFWIHTFERSVDSVIKKAVESQENCIAYFTHVHVHFEYRTEYFDDSYLNQKAMENAAAVSQLPSLLKSIDEYFKVVSDPQRLFLVTRGLLAGNVFDWGAQKVIKCLRILLSIFRSFAGLAVLLP
uniref:Sulfotransfer_1 domain-containing protein n=1 Tax=Angiostrongylus cantonensis TaxID=6313 RepID=A0A0K0D7R9_ANGCA